jgi:hypothetical protein
MTTEKAFGRFSVTVAPIPGESLNGYIMRVADRYLIGTVTELLAACGTRPSTIRHLHADDGAIENVALRLGVSVSELQKRRYQAQAGLQNTMWFGPHRIDREVYVGQSPRIAPHTFRSAGHHKMVWDLQFVVADLDTCERLIDACPHCGQGFRWANSNFLNCHKCGEDLAQGAPDMVDLDTRTAIRGLSGLVSLDPEVVHLAEADLAPEIRALGPEKLFQFVFSMAAGIDQEEALRRAKTELGRLKETKKPGRRTAHLDWEKAVVRAYQVATGWPNALLGYLEEERMISEERAGDYGTKKAFGHFQILLREWSAEAEIWAVVVPAIRTFLEAHPEMSLKAGTPLAEAVGDVSDGIMLRDVKAKYGWSHRRITQLLKFPGVLLSEGQGSGTPLRISRKKVEEVMLALQDIISPRGIRAEWRVRHDVVADICDGGLLKQVEPEYLPLVGIAKALYRRADVTAIAQALEASVRSTRVSGTQVTTRVVVEMLTKNTKNPWSVVVSAVLKGELIPVAFNSDEKNILERMIFDRDVAHKWAYAEMAIENPTYSQEQVAARLMVETTVVAALTRDGYLKVYRDMHGGQAGRFLKEDIDAFDQKYISQIKLRRTYEARQRNRAIHPELVMGSCKFFRIEPLQLRGMPTRLYPRQSFPKNFRIMGRKELHENGVLRNKLLIGRNDPSQRLRR